MFVVSGVRNSSKSRKSSGGENNNNNNNQKSMTAEDLLDGYDEELGVGGAQERDWKGIGTALFVIVMICLLIFVALVLFTPLTGSKALSPKKLSPSDFGLLRFPFNEIEINSKGEITTQTYEGIEVLENHTHRLIFARENLADLIPSSDDKWILIREKSENPGLNPENVTYRVKIQNVETTFSYPIGVQKEDSSIQAIQMNTKKGQNDLAFVEHDKLYYLSSPESSSAIRVDLENDHLVQGIFDWVYTEEIFGSNVALWWSKNGNYLAFASYDNHMTRNVSLKSYNKENNYPITTFLAYPKTFEKNLPKYTLSIWDKSSELVKHLDLQLKDSLDYHYLYAVKWLEQNGEQVLVAVFSNRIQNKISITLCDFQSSTCRLKFEYKYKEQRWAVHDDFEGMVIHNNRLYFILPHDLKGNAYQHIASIDLTATNPRVDFENLDEFDVSKIVDFNEQRGEISFTAAAPTPRQIHTFILQLGTKSTPKCVSCKIESCSRTATKLSADFRSAKVMCKGPGATKIVTISRGNDEWESYVETYRDEEYEKRYNESGMPTNIFGSVDLENGFEGLYKLSLPQSAKHERVKLPVLVYVYAGPNDQKVMETNNFGFEEMISINQQVALLRIDGRGTGGRGWKYRSPIYGELGKFEVEDQIAVIEKVLEQHHQLDSTRVAVSGWSYGGFMSLAMVEEAKEEFFKCAISVAPVTNFKFYDATYTERYMGNSTMKCYTDVTKNLDNFKKTRLLLMHGLLDDNVHFQNSAVLIEELQTKGIDFDLMVYPNEQHSIAGKSPYVGMKMSKFIEKCFAV
ncbi:unnamed protein product [Caenorhabditis angaria]|uniref:Uncharacterized protein n=1 Tax=Caenorhabditis angaria TaxID=860376 RepID=A0A9P1IXV8_9PELO|nr:unnamed protein product [Caenorhabditis angaria]